jgi:DNA polymerase delta subunit 2
LQACPHLFFIGNQPEFKSVVVESEPPFRLNGDSEMTDAESTTRVRLVSIPKFHQTGELVLVDSETLEVEVVKFKTFGG